MRTLAIAFLALAGAVGAADPVPPPPRDEVGERLFLKIDPSVVMLSHEKALGSGFIVTADGYILTNGHVVMDDADEEDPKAVAKRITVTLSNERKYRAVVVGHCLDPDVALVKIQPSEPLVPAELGDSDAARPGQRCYAFGSPRGLKRTLTSGILSNVERTDLGTFTWVFQTDAAINPGNSGGPLFNEQGQVLGINTYGGGGQNLGFTLPINVAKVLRAHYLEHGRFLRSKIHTLAFQEISPDLEAVLGVTGVLVGDVLPGSEAEKAGFSPGDVITAVDGEPAAAKNATELLRFQWGLVTRPVGSKVVFTVRTPLRKASAEREVVVVLREDDPAPASGHQRGEIPQAVYAELGLAVQRLVPASRTVYNLPDAPGVLVSNVQDNTPAQKAGLQRGDIVTEVEGAPTPGPDAFRDRLLSALKTRKKAVCLVVRRQKNVIRTALAPYYTLAGKRVALLAPPGDAEWTGLLRQSLLVSGAEVLDDFRAEGLDGLLLGGGAGGLAFREDAGLLARIREMSKAGKALGAVGPSVLSLLKADPDLLARKVTLPEEQAQEATALKAKYTGKDVETDGKLVTCTGFDKANVRAFLKAFGTALSGD